VSGPTDLEHEYRERALRALVAGDWHDAYRWAKGWIGRGGGAWIVDPWLVYAASALLHRQPRSAIHQRPLTRIALPQDCTDGQRHECPGRQTKSDLGRPVLDGEHRSKHDRHDQESDVLGGQASNPGYR
jgi:hypothetical protein